VRMISRWASHELRKSTLTDHSGAVLCIGGPWLVWYVTPTEEELFKVTHPSRRAFSWMAANVTLEIQPRFAEAVVGESSRQAARL